MIDQKHARDSILYVRISKINLEWLDTMVKHTGYKSRSEFVDNWFKDLRVKIGGSKRGGDKKGLPRSAKRASKSR